MEARTKRYQVECTLIQPDADGEAGKGKVLAQPVLCMVEGVEGYFCCGGQMEYPALRQAEKQLAKWKATVTLVDNGEGSAYKDILVTVNEQ